MNNNVSPEKKDSILKSLAIVGFIGIIILIAWLSIQLVNFIPGAFSSLASIAEGLDQYKETVVEEIKEDEPEMVKFSVTSEKTLVSKGEEVVLNWEDSSKSGSYTFAYECADGVSVDIFDNEGTKSIDCNNNYNVGDRNNLTISVDSEKERYSLLKYSISFLKTEDSEPSAKAESSLTVYNSDVNDVIADSENEDTTEVITPTESTSNTDTTSAGNNDTTPTTVAGNETVYKQEFVYQIPTSDPNGRTDLSIKFLNTGTIVGNTFFPGKIKTEEEGALQFEVKNYGTKTSKEWTYSLTLPNGGTYTSNKQLPLKPNERAVIVVGFPTTEDTTHTFKGSIKDSSDVNSINNQFSQSVTFVR